MVATAAPSAPASSGGGAEPIVPLPPEPPAVITRAESGLATIRAVRVSQPLKIDGRLDEEVYGAVLAAGDFIQQEPTEGEPATEKTEIWVLFDNENLYVSARCWDDHPERWVLTELRRDNNNIISNENLSVVLDTFHDRRNGFHFQTTPLGAIRDAAFTDEGNVNTSWNASGAFQIEFQNSDQWILDYTRDFEYLARNFEIAPKVILPVGGYDYGTVRTTYSVGQQHRIAGRLSVASGTFYNGHKREATFTMGRAALSARVNIEPGITLNWVDLPEGSFRNRLITARGILTPTPRTLVSSLFQYNASDHGLSSSVRLRWEYTGGSELFVVYSDGRNTSVAGEQQVLNWSVALKLTRLVRF